MKCDKFRILLDEAEEMDTRNYWGQKAFLINNRIWELDRNNFNACKRLGRYYLQNGNISDAKRMYMKALEIYPNNYEVIDALIEIEKCFEKVRFLDALETGRECYDTGLKMMKSRNYWLASECFKKAYGCEPSFKYGLSLAKSYSRMGETGKIKKIYLELLENTSSPEVREDIEIEFVELLRSGRFEEQSLCRMGVV